MRKLTVGLGLSLGLAASAASAQEPAKPASAAELAKDEPSKGADGVRRDPKGIKGISPFMELIVKGDRAFVARDFDAATATYREAIQREPQNPIGHYRMGSAQLVKGDQKEAEAAFTAGLRFVGKDASLQAKLLFALAELRERALNSDEAIARWKEYAKHAEENKEAITYPATAAERVKRNETWKKTLSDSVAVKARIDQRLKEADEASRKSASDPKNK